MLSILVSILVALSVIAISVSVGEHFLPQILDWFNNAIDQVYQLLPLFPTWVLPYILVALVLALLSLGVKLL